jgi:hypothetical protein
MIKTSWIKRWLIACFTVCFCLFSHWLLPVGAGTSSANLTRTFTDFFNTPLDQLPKTLCTDKLKNQFKQQTSNSLNCNNGNLVTADRLLMLGNFTDLGLTKTSLQELARVNGLDLNKISADKLQKFYGLLTPATLLGNKFNNFYQNKSLASLPLIKEALIQDITNRVKIGDLSQLQPLNNLIRQAGGIPSFQINNVINVDQLRQQISNLVLSKVVAAIPKFGSFSLANLPKSVLQSYSVAAALPDLVRQPLDLVPNIGTLTVNALKAAGLNKLSMFQLPRRVALVAGVQLGKFDLPLSSDERDLGRQISGGLPGDILIKQNCRSTCKVAEISSVNPSYNGSTWADGGEHWVPDGFGPLCAVWPGGCRGPAGNHPFGNDFRVLLTNINASAGTAQVSVTFRFCTDFHISCSPSVFPIPSGLPIATIREGTSLPFIVPQNYSASAIVSPDASIDFAQKLLDNRRSLDLRDRPVLKLVS